MRIAVLPRDDAARVITSATAGGVWVVNIVSLALSIPLLIEYLVLRGAGEFLVAPVAILVGLIVIAVWAWIYPRPWVVILFLVVGAVATVAYELFLISVVPSVLVDGYFVLNRPAVSLVLVAVGSTTWLGGLAWILLGYLVSIIASVYVAASSGQPFTTGWGPSLVFVVYASTFLVLAAIQSNQRRLVPNLDELEADTHRLAIEESMRSRVTAAVHDTLLNDLAIVMNSPDELDERVTSRLRADLATLTSAEWLREMHVAVDDQDSSLRNQVMQMMSDLQWRGLSVHVTGSGSGIYRLEAAIATAIVDAIRACLENVLRHSGATIAEVDLAYSDDAITVIVADQGTGFDPQSIATNRLGVRVSVIERIEAVGGTVKIWSSPGNGCSVVMRIPFLERVTPHEESNHGSD